MQKVRTARLIRLLSLLVIYLQLLFSGASQIPTTNHYLLFASSQDLLTARGGFHQCVKPLIRGIEIALFSLAGRLRQILLKVQEK